jgi:hypothetical protein
MPLTLRPTGLAPADADRQDWIVYEDGRPIGRIYEDASAGTPLELRWFWSITEIVPASSATHGHAATREQAMAKFRAAWEKAKAGGKAVTSHLRSDAGLSKK